jgi:hypothetical protein
MFFVSHYCGRVIDFGCCADANDKLMKLFLECEVGKFGSEQTVDKGDAVKGEWGICPSYGRADYSYVWYGGMVMDGKVSYGFHGRRWCPGAASTGPIGHY